jgi:hypothetical protein
MQAITTKYFGPTNTRGARIKASCPAGSVSVPYDDELNTEEMHTAAFKVLVAKLGWTTPSYGNWFIGGTQAGYVFVASGREGIGAGSHFTYQVA